MSPPLLYKTPRLQGLDAEIAQMDCGVDQALTEITEAQKKLHECCTAYAILKIRHAHFQEQEKQQARANNSWNNLRHPEYSVDNRNNEDATIKETLKAYILGQPSNKRKRYN
jgi:hypothetical protein